MPDKSRASAIRDTSAAFGKALLHPSVLLVIIPSVVLAMRSPWGVLTLDVTSLSSATFAIAGTMVALILPASQLVNSFLVRLEDIIKSLIKAEDATTQQKDEVGNQFIDEVKRYLAPAWRASAFVFVSFLLSIAAMILPEREIPIDGPFALPVRSLIVGLAIWFLIVGSMWFLPAAWYSFDFALLEKMKETLRIIVDSERGEGIQSQARELKPAAELANQVKKEDKAKESEPPAAGCETGRK